MGKKILYTLYLIIINVNKLEKRKQKNILN